MCFDFEQNANQIASVNRRYRHPLGVGLGCGRVLYDSAHLTAPVTELTSEGIRQEVM